MLKQMKDIYKVLTKCLILSKDGQMGEKTAIFGRFSKGLVISRLCFCTFSKVFPYGARRPVLPTKTTCFAH